MDFIEFQKKFGSEKKVIEYFIKQRYPGGIKCNFCNSKKVYQRKKTPKVFDCGFCGRSFSIFKDTIFEKTSTDLRKWMYAIHLFLNAKKGISAKQLQRETGVTYKTAWRMLKQIRKAMSNTENHKFTSTILEIGETYIGGKPRKSNKKDCSLCPLKEKCISGKGNFRIVSHYDSPCYEKARTWYYSGYGKVMQKLRGTTIEGIMGQAKTYHGMAKTRFRGLAKVQIQFLLTATAPICYRLVS